MLNINQIVIEGLKSARWVYAYNMFAISGTFNSLIATASGFATLNQRWFFRSFVDNQIRISQFNYRIPQNYKPDSDIDLEIYWTSNNANKNCRWHLGLCTLDGVGLYGGALESQWIVANVPGPLISGFKEMRYKVSFDGTGLLPGDSISFMMMREGNHSGDTMTGAAYINGAVVDIETDKL